MISAMDALIANMANPIIFILKIVLVVGGCFVALINYFHIKEANKMQKKMDIALPSGVGFGMSVQLLLSVVFVFASTVYLFIF